MGSRKNDAAMTTADILAHVAREGPLTLSAITANVDRTVGTVHTYVQSLLEKGLLQRSGETYQLSPEFVVYGDIVRYRSPLYRHGREQVDDLVEQTDETALIMLEHDGRECILYEGFGENAVGTDYYERNRGAPQPLYCTASGKAVLAHLDADTRERILTETNLEEQTPRTITDPDVLRQELAAIRDEGVAYNDEEQLRGLRAVAAPVVTDGTVRGAISLGGPRSRIEDERFTERFPELVRRASNVVEVEIRAADEQE